MSASMACISIICTWSGGTLGALKHLLYLIVRSQPSDDIDVSIGLDHNKTVENAV